MRYVEIWRNLENRDFVRVFADMEAARQIRSSREPKVPMRRFFFQESVFVEKTRVY